MLPKEVLWLEVAELAEHSVPLVAQRAEAILADRSVPPTVQEVHELWQQHQSLIVGIDAGREVAEVASA